LSNSCIRSLDAINDDRFSNLRTLILDNNLISDMTSLSSLSQLQILRLNRNRIVSVPFNPQGQGYFSVCFSQLEILDLGNNRINSIASLHLSGLKLLRVLTLEGNEITRIDGLQGLPNLQQLILSKNKIKKLDPQSLEGLMELRSLQLEENGLRSLVNLGPLPKLRSLFLAFNCISELSEIDYLLPPRFAPNLYELTLRNNTVARKPHYRSTIVYKIPSLTVLDGKEVSQEEKDCIEQNQDVASSYYPFQNMQSNNDKVPLKLQSFAFNNLNSENNSNKANSNKNWESQQIQSGGRTYNANSANLPSMGRESKNSAIGSNNSNYVSVWRPQSNLAVISERFKSRSSSRTRHK